METLIPQKPWWINVFNGFNVISEIKKPNKINPHELWIQGPEPPELNTLNTFFFLSFFDPAFWYGFCGASFPLGKR